MPTLERLATMHFSAGRSDKVWIGAVIAEEMPSGNQRYRYTCLWGRRYGSLQGLRTARPLTDLSSAVGEFNREVFRKDDEGYQHIDWRESRYDMRSQVRQLAGNDEFIPSTRQVPRLHRATMLPAEPAVPVVETPPARSAPLTRHTPTGTGPRCMDCGWNRENQNYHLPAPRAANPHQYEGSGRSCARCGYSRENESRHGPYTPQTGDDNLMGGRSPIDMMRQRETAHEFMDVGRRYTGPALQYEGMSLCGVCGAIQDQNFHTNRYAASNDPNLPHTFREPGRRTTGVRCGLCSRGVLDPIHRDPAADVVMDALVSADDAYNPVPEGTATPFVTEVPQMPAAPNPAARHVFVAGARMRCSICGLRAGASRHDPDPAIEARRRMANATHMFTPGTTRRWNGDLECSLCGMSESWNKHVVQRPPEHTEPAIDPNAREHRPPAIRRPRRELF